MHQKITYYKYHDKTSHIESINHSLGEINRSRFTLLRILFSHHKAYIRGMYTENQTDINKNSKVSILRAIFHKFAL